MDNLTLGLLQRAKESLPPKVAPTIMFAHPDEFDGIVDAATKAGAYVIPYGEQDDGWHYLIVFVFEGSGWLTAVNDELLLTSRLPRGGVYVAPAPEYAILKPPISLYPTR
jgi:hypothetical protein